MNCCIVSERTVQRLQKISKKISEKSKLKEMHPLQLIKSDIEESSNLIQHMDDTNKRIITT